MGRGDSVNSRFPVTLAAADETDKMLEEEEKKDDNGSWRWKVLVSPLGRMRWL